MRARLSVRVRIRNRIRIRVAVGRGDRIAGDPVAPVGPPRQVFVPAALAAEWLPPIVARPLVAQHAQRRLIHPNYFSGLPRASSRGTVLLPASEPPPLKLRWSGFVVRRLTARVSSWATSSFTVFRTSFS